MEDPLDILTRKVWVGTAEQLLTHTTKATLDRLVREGWLRKLFPVARGPVKHLVPLAHWFPSLGAEVQTPPGRVVELARERWAPITGKTVPVYVATPKAADLTGGVATGEITHFAQLSHDLAALSVYLRLGEEVRASFMGERLLRVLGWDRHTLVPDGVAYAPDYGGWTAFDVIGEGYGRDRVQAIQDFCVEHGIGYQLW